MRQLCFMVSLLWGLNAGGPVATAADATAVDQPHPVEFWRAVAKSNYAVPPGGNALALARELTAWVGDTDPELRDGLGYTITDEWVQRGVLGANELRVLMALWRSNLTAPGPDKVLNRAFGALNLALVAAVDARTPFLTEEEYRALLEPAMALLATETDLRGWDPQQGWVHVTAHTADLLKFLARSSRLRPADQAHLLEAVAVRLQTAPHVFTCGEDERLAAIVVSLARRPDFDQAALLTVAKRLASLPEGFDGFRPQLAAYAARRNALAFLKSVYLSLGLEGTKLPAAKSAAGALLAALAE